MSTIPNEVLNDPSLFYGWLIQSRQKVRLSLPGKDHKNYTGTIVSKEGSEICLSVFGGSQMMIIQESMIQTVAVL